MKNSSSVRPRFILPSLTTALLIFGTASMEAQVFTKPSGFVTIAADAAADASTPTYTFVSHSLARKRKAVVTATGATTSTVTVANVNWDGTEFVGANGPHYLLVESGDSSGLNFDITGMTSDTLTLDVGERDASILNGQELTIYQHNTLGTVFGTEDPTPTGFLSGESSEEGNQVLFYDSGSQSFQTFFYNTRPSDFLTTRHQGWVSQSAPSVPAEDTIIEPNRGFIILNRNVEDFETRVFGDVIDSDVTVPVIAEGYNLVNVPYPVPSGLTLGTSGLYDADNFDPTIHLRPGPSAEEADQVVLRVNGAYQIYFINSRPSDFLTTRHVGWVNQNSTSVDAESTVIPEGAFFVFRADDGTSIDWTFPTVVSENP